MRVFLPSWPNAGQPTPDRTARLDGVLGILSCGHLVAKWPATHDVAGCLAHLNLELDAYFERERRRGAL
jgi:hypothetical protein